MTAAHLAMHLNEDDWNLAVAVFDRLWPAKLGAASHLGE